MELSVTLQENEYLTKGKKQEIDKQIDEIIKNHKNNAFEINRLVFDSVTALTASDSRANELSEQGVLKRFWGELTGENQKLQSEIDRNLSTAQYCSQQILQKLAEQNLMNFELITTVNNKLNSLTIEVEGEINEIYETLVTFFKQTRSNIIQLETRVEILEKNVNLLKWLNTIEYLMLDGVEYSELNKIEKIVCIANDFYSITKGKWTTSDLVLIKSALSEIGLSTKEKISYKEFIEYVSENKNLFSKLVDEDITDLVNIDTDQMPIISGLVKEKLLESSERYIVNTVKSQLKVNGICVNDKKLRYSITENYIEETEFININSQVNLFDFIIELLFNIKIFKCSCDNFQAINVKNKIINNKKFENIDSSNKTNLNEIKLYAGDKFGAIIDENDELFIWGNTNMSDYDLIGNMPRNNNEKWIDVAIGKCVSSNDCCCGVTIDNKIIFWPNRLGITKWHEKYLKLMDIVQVSTGQGPFNLIALDKSGQVYCYSSCDGGKSLVPYNLGKAVKVLSDGSDFYVLCENGRVYNWKFYKGGKVKFDVSHWRDIKDIAVDRGSIIALDKRGNVFVFSNNRQIYNIPKDLKDIIAISMGEYHAIVLDKRGNVHVWGSDNVDILKQVLIVPKDVKNIVKIAAGSEIMMALDVSGKVHMWGNNEYINCCVPSKFCI
ncbi:hypothetical protein [Clostridium ljungdahlii]|uniref:Regulator of chromosome condensation (RCC1) repeat protein n=1 Tax=Clostridium ljungdahlii (strain ATCC 55383 / DSM 13528 / PETC) TaxID=748727 RepID=D8GLR5_CLOLD|nr:hypothetical protein [Clostridium ljungdahlii]ADK13461.1 hypothetical protein CLJU_c03790 [Clostridium ljungdahlii DSM 13528]OAA89080.1 hypothetical protein WX45_02321 [Clostridium ljungdahlii DSM 13528]